MAIQRSQGIVLRRQDLRETSIILTFYAKGFGKMKGILRGVRGARGQNAGAASFEIFAYDEIIFYERKRGDVYTVSQCDLIDYFGPVRESLEKLAYAAYLVELLDSVTSLGDPNDDIFELVLSSLRLLKGGASPKRVARIFEIKLLHELGLMPTLTECASCGNDAGPAARFSFRHGGLICKGCLDTDRQAVTILPGTAKFIEHIRTVPFERAANVKVAAQVGKELERVLRRFLDYQIGRRLKTVSFIKQTEAA